MEWVYQDTVITHLPPAAYGFIYQLHFDDGYKYIGKKDAYATLEKPAKKSGEVREGCERVYHNILRNEQGKIIVSKKDQQAAKNRGCKGTREAYDRGIYESNWRTYESSSEEVKNYKLISKEILEFAPTKRALTYLETKYLFCNDAIIDPLYLNKNIIKRWFRDNLF